MKTGLFDIETDGLLPEVSTVWCAVVKDLDNGTVRKFDPSNVHLLCDYLNTFGRLIGHNVIAYDFPVLRKVYGWEYKGEIVDTLLMSRTQRPNRLSPPDMPDKSRPHSVEAYGYRFGDYKLEHEDWSQFSHAMMRRCVQDVEVQHKIYTYLLEEGKDEGWENAHRLNARLFHNLQRQEEYGWHIDRSLLDAHLATLTRWVDRIDRTIGPLLPLICEPKEIKKLGEYGYVKKPFLKSGQLSEAVVRHFDCSSDCGGIAGPFSRVGFRHVDINSNAEVKEFLLASGWEPDEWNTNNDGKRTSPKFSKDDSFTGIQGGLGRLVAKRIQCRQRYSILEGWQDAIREDGRLAPRVAGIASTGRIRHAGLVNVPSPGSNAFFAKQMRSIFSSKEGYVLVGTDSKGNQIRQLAARMGDPEFTKAVLFGNSKDGTDLHSLNQKRTGVGSRNLAKNFFYGFLFGAGDAKIGKIVGGGPAEGKALKAEYYAKTPALRDLLDRMIAEWRDSAQKWYNPKYNRMEYRNGYVKGLDGRPILVESEHSILVYFLQSDEAIQMAAAYNILHKWLSEKYVYGEDFGFVIWYHDEYVIECKKEIADDVAFLSREAIAWAGRYYNIECPHEGDSKIGRSWYDVH